MVAGLVFVAAIDITGRVATVTADGRLDRLFFVQSGPYSADLPTGFRVLRDGSQVELPGLPASRPVSVEVQIAANRPEHSKFCVNESCTSTDIGGRVSLWRFSGTSDKTGLVRFRTEGQSRSGVRLYWAKAVSLERGLIPLGRLGRYVLALALFTLIDHWLAAGPAGLVLPLGSVVLGLGIAADRALMSAYLPSVLLATCGAALVGVALHRGLSMKRGLALAAAACLAFRALMGLDPAFFEMDLSFHEHRLEAFQKGELIYSGVQDPGGTDGAHLAIPYPPGLYAVLEIAKPLASPATVLRITMVLLETTAPLLIWWLMRATGCSEAAAGYGLLAAAVVPEGLLVLMKGIAANIFGQWVSIVAIGLFSLRRHPVVLTAIACLVFLSHPGSAACLGAYLVAWSTLEYLSGEGAREGVGRLFGSTVLGALAAWGAYYREVSNLTRSTVGQLGSFALRRQAAVMGRERFFGARWMVLGKVAQNLILKLGGGIVPLALYGLMRASFPRETRRVIAAWLTVSGALFLAAVFTPIAFRFEYFSVPAIAISAGLGAEDLDARGHNRAVQVCLLISAGVQVVIGAFHMAGRFAPWAVIIPAHWEFPFRWT
jgi:hypothetical protein